ncbi:MAG: long-chain-fatty-acid--CoA ligase [Rhodospirillales bacterium]
MSQITQFLRRAVQIAGRGIATICGERQQDWATFANRAARLAGALAGLGFKPGDRIGILALNSDRYLESFFGLAWGGFVFVPINTRLAPPEIVFWLSDSGCAGLLIDDAFVPVLPKVLPETPEMRHVVYIGDGPTPAGQMSYEALVAAAEPVEDAGRCDNDMAGIFYTGGTTGRSKGVMLSHNNILSNAHNISTAAPFGRQTCFIHAAPMFHLADGAMTFIVTANGGRHVFLPRFDPASFLSMVEEYGVTTALIVPTMVNMIVHHPDMARRDLSSFQDLLYGASPMPEAVILRAMELMPKLRFTQAYGQSEASPLMTLMAPEDLWIDGKLSYRLKSAGRGVLDCEIAILDENDKEVPRGTVGEVCGRGKTVMSGYWKQPELTAHTLRNGWLHTGDGGYMDEDGFVYIVDRVKDMIVSGGENVYSAEVEEALYSHPAVAECAVIGIPDDRWGERVHAIVRFKPDMSATEQELIAACHARIANYKCPRSVTIAMDSLPLSGAGKILKSELRKPYWEGREKRVN